MDDKPNVKKALKELARAIVALLNDLDDLDKSNIRELLKAFQVLYDVKEELNDQTDLVNKVYNRYSYEVVPNAMETEGFDSIKANGRNYIVAVRTNASIPNDKREAGFQWLRENEGTELITQNVNSRTLTSFVKSYIDNTGRQPPEEAVSLHLQKYMSVRKS